MAKQEPEKKKNVSGLSIEESTKAANEGWLNSRGLGSSSESGSDDNSQVQVEQTPPAKKVDESVLMHTDKDGDGVEDNIESTTVIGEKKGLRGVSHSPLVPTDSANIKYTPRKTGTVDVDALINDINENRTPREKRRDYKKETDAKVKAINDEAREQRFYDRQDRRVERAEFLNQARKDIKDASMEEMREFVGGLTGKDYNGVDNSNSQPFSDGRQNSFQQSQNASGVSPEAEVAKAEGMPSQENKSDVDIPPADAEVAASNVQNDAQKAEEEAVKSEDKTSGNGVLTSSEKNAEGSDGNVDQLTVNNIPEVDKDEVLGEYDNTAGSMSAYDQYMQQYNDWMKSRAEDEARMQRLNNSYSTLAAIGNLAEKIANLGGTLAGGVSSPDNGVSESVLERYDKIREARQKQIDDIRAKMFELQKDRTELATKNAKERFALGRTIDEENRAIEQSNITNRINASRAAAQNKENEAHAKYYNDNAGKASTPKTETPQQIQTRVLKSIGATSIDDVKEMYKNNTMTPEKEALLKQYAESLGLTLEQLKNNWGIVSSSTSANSGGTEEDSEERVA